jgi:hypothetical protein
MESPPFELCPPHEAFYISSLLFCTKSARASTIALSDLLKKCNEGFRDFDPRVPLNHIQNIVLQAAAVSRFFWPADKKHQWRGHALREAFHVSDSSNLHSRTLRNTMEHFDEYLDDFLRQEDAGHFIPDYFGPKPPAERGSLKIFRAYFLDTGEFEILGSLFLIPPIVDDLARLHNKLAECDENGSRFPRASKQT